jgi:hypothetical protein
MRVCAHNGQNSGGQAQELIGALGSVRVLVHLCSSQQPEVPLTVLFFPDGLRCERGSKKVHSHCLPAGARGTRAALRPRPGAPEEG